MAYLKLLGQDVLHGAHVCFDQIPSVHCVSRAVDTEHRKRLADARKTPDVEDALFGLCTYSRIAFGAWRSESATIVVLRSFF